MRDTTPDTRHKERKKQIFILLFSCILCLVSCALVFAEDTRITSSLDKQSAQVGEEIRMTIRIAGAAGNIQAPHLPSFQGFDTFYTGRASHISFINGVSSSNIEFSYSLVPKEAGHHRLDPIEVIVNGQRFATAPVEIDVTSGSGTSPRPSYTSQNAPFNPNARPMRSQVPSNALPPSAPGSNPGAGAGQEPPPNFVPNDDNIFVRAWTDKTTAYPNEQVLLTYSLYTRYDTRYEGFDKEPEISGFWIEDFPMDQDVRRETVTMNGKRYLKADVKMTALFPTTPAEYTIDPGTIKASVRQEPENSNMFDEFFNDSFFSNGGFFARRENRLLKPAPIHVTVKPFPEQGKPDNFEGAVGNFRLSATVDKQSVKQNEPVTMKLILEGEGNLETIKKPQIPEMKEFKVYDADSSSQMFKTGNVIGGRKTFEVVFIPIKAGPLKIPKLSFSYFNPQKGYATLNTPEFNLAVTPSDQQFQLPKELSGSDQLKKEISVEGKDIRYIVEKLPEDHDFILRGVLNAMLLGNMGMILALLVGFMRRRQELVYAGDSALKRRKFAKMKAEKAIRGLRKDKAHYFDEAEKILTHYLSDHFNLSAHGMTRYELESQLREALGHEDPLFQDIHQFYEVCDESRFGKGEVPEALRTKAAKILKETISRVEKMKS